MTASRITAARVAWISERLGLRDLKVIRSLDRVRVATTQQLQRLHFIEGTALSNARTCRATLTRLSRWRALSRLERRVGGVRAGSAGFVYALGVAGQRLAGEEGFAGGTRQQKPWTPSEPFLKHRLATTELYVRLVEACRRSGQQLVEFETEPRCWRSFTGAAGQVLTLKPDAFLRLAGRDFTDYAFIEVDLGTESPRALASKFDRYREYWASSIEQRRHGVFPQVVWLAPNGPRGQVLIDVAGRQPAEAWQLFRVVAFDVAAEALTGSDHA